MIDWNVKTFLKMATFIVVAVFGLGLAGAASADLLTTFELDGNATTQNPNPVLPDDWDRVLLLGTGHQALSTGLLVDPSDSTRFTVGSKDIGEISTSWHWDDATSPDKDEITNAYAALYSNNRFYFGCDRFATNGTSYIGFWLLQGSVSRKPDGSFSGNHVLGDILILSDFTQGGGLSTIRVFKWVGTGGSDGSLDSVHVNPLISFAIVNSADQPSPWSYTPKFGTAGTFPTGAFIEGGADLTALGITGCFTNFLCETRASASVTAELKDFVLGRFPAAPEVTVNSPAVCQGESDTLFAAVTGGVPSFTYLWNTTATTPYIIVSSAGTYTVTVTGANGCSGSGSGTLTVNQPPVLSCVGDLLTCDSLLASATVTSTPSVGVSYVWSPAPVSGQGTANARYNAPGTKKVVVTILASGCKDSCEAVITQNIIKPVLSCAGDLLTCDSLLASATVTSTPSVGVSYAWSPAPVSGQGTASARYNAPGTKKVVVTILASGCKDSCEAVITQNIIKPVLSCAGDLLTCDSLLASATVTSTPSVGVSYAWSPAPVSGQGTASARYNAPGTKKVVVTILASGCKDSCEAVITQDITKPVLSCAGDLLTCDSLLASATVTSTPSVGVSYVWSPAPVIGQGTANARYNAPGTKKVVVTILASGCKDSCEAVITQTATKPILSCAGDELTCDSLLASATVTSTPSVGVSYAWSPAPVIGQGTANARYNAPGNKKVVVTILATGCKDSCEAVITQNITKPILSCGGDQLTCDSLLASATVTSTPSVGVSYVWSPAPVIGQGTANARYNAPGNKKVVVTILATGCKDSCEAVITQNITKPILSCAGDELTCDSLLASATVTSTPSVGVSYVWSPAPVIGQGTANARYNAPGNKKVVVTIVATGCKDSCEAVITQNITKPVLSCAGDELTCDSLLASATVTSTPSVGVSYAWSPAPVIGQGTAKARYDTPGTKKVVVTIVATGCKDSCEAVITQTVIKPVLNCQGDDLSCDSLLASATVTSTPSVGVSYVWSPAPVSGQGTPNARYDSPGTKKVVVTTVATGCKDSCNAVITQNIIKPVLACSGDTLTCDSLLASAKVTSDPSVGVTYAWSPAPVSGQGTNHARYDTPGTKKVVVTTVATGCKDSCNAIIAQDVVKPTCTLTAPATLPDCGSTGNVLTATTGGAVLYHWSVSGTGWAITAGNTTNSVTYNAGDAGSQGTFKIVLTAVNGCKDSCEVTFGCTPRQEFCTYTMGGWGSGCPDSQKERMNSTQPGCIRDHFFAQVYPQGYVLIGDPDGPDGDNFYSAKWTSAAAVEAFLPSGSTATYLTTDMTNPGSKTAGGVLGGQILALRLNRDYSCAGIFTGLGMPGVCFSSYVIPDSCGKFAGLTVDRFLAIADSAIGGKTQALLPFGARLADLVYTADCLNEAFDDCGVVENGEALISKPLDLMGQNAGELPALPTKFAVGQSHPNPFNPMTTINYALPTEGRVTIEIYDIVGRKVATLLNTTKPAGYYSVAWYGKDDAGNLAASGVYFCRVQFGDKADVKKMLMLK